MIDLFYKNSQSQNLAGHHLHQKIRKYSETLPNISGQVGQVSSDLLINSGSFRQSYLATQKDTSIIGTTQGNMYISFNAYDSSAIYASSSTVQPSAYQTLIIIKI